MNIIHHPAPSEWRALSRRPYIETEQIESMVRTILQQVRTQGNVALRKLTARFDKATLDGFRVSPAEFDAAASVIPETLKQAIEVAQTNIERFHERQREAVDVVETMPGVTCWRRSVPIERVGLYIPGGSAPLFSTLLMLGIPARLAGCHEVIVCTPCDIQGRVADVILYTAQRIGIQQVYKVGGAQAIAAMAYGTLTIPRVDKIFGPGNQYVTTAKLLVQQEGLPIDLPAGPSELLIIADEQSNPAFVAADLLSQAEHGSDSQVILVTDSQRIITDVQQELDRQLTTLPRQHIAQQALAHSKAILVADLQQAVAFSNTYAPEHLIIATANASSLAERVINAGSVFLGNYSCESAGDYASGTNHTLPTNGFARNYSGVSLDSFVKKITFQQLTEEGIRNIGPAIEQLAAAEQLEAHKNAVTIRLKELGVRE